MGLVALIAVGATFAVAAIALAVLSLLAGDRAKVRDAWTVYALQFLTMGVILVPAYVGGILFTVVVALLAGLCLLEFLGAQKDAVPIAMKVTAVAFGAGTCVLAHLRPFPELYLAIPLAAAALLAVSLFLTNERRHLHSLSASMLGLVAIPVFLSHAILIRKLDNGFLVLFFMYGLSEIHDSFAYLFGKMLGRKRIFPNISPNKTYVGFASGIVAATAAGIALNLTVTRFSAAYAAAAIAVIITFTILGDLASSKIKRFLGVKDFGRLLPRTGGCMTATTASCSLRLSCTTCRCWSRAR